MEKQQTTISVSVPDKEVIDLVDTMADLYGRSRSQQIVYLIRAEAEKLGFIPRRLSSAVPAEK